jgi:hypothetical protein
MRYVITNKKINALAIHDPERQREQKRCFDMQPNGSARRAATQQESKRKLRCRSNRAIAICCRGQQPSASLLIWLGLSAPDFVLLLMAVRATHFHSCFTTLLLLHISSAWIAS